MVEGTLEPKVKELQLVRKFIELSKEIKALNKTVAAKKDEYLQLEEEIMDHLEAEGKKASARFLGIGHVTCRKPTPRASMKLGEEEILFAHLRKIGRADLIQTKVDSRQLSTLVRECLEDEKEIPPGINYILQTKLLVFPAKS